MKKSGLTIGAAALLFGLGAALLSPICVPCLSLLFGILAGYLAGEFDKAPNQGNATKNGALGGLLAGVGLLVGQIAGAVVNTVVVGPMGATRMLYDLGIPAGSPAQIQDIYYPTIILATTCLSIFDAALMAGLGALGGMLWWQVSGRKQNPPVQVLDR